mmetsp:Transcript_13060/g.40224  ORF Transcript_13060/g.40224 Transcript_13060/m.40224 type:complete len:498 (+) Transcript_13060:216-1709(+)|eukprot:CAMPEP_0198730130 /NCGR_PEP_ID=MMETSP1475-20131203/22969_1 /TAXON_ID= ORGANISM="Unidentified sp., Strain CCMP1999" /NCGR_SAMPLE_ID=MMETSP1475 /ASSEMBLY_ACC=CAM_ASM_001111 /LENGTH=497 /DNA_ID=CAMNT_0044492901 /DNA_START=193 /DNA_END=1686 /DNA_ORIENTATION=+
MAKVGPYFVSETLGQGSFGKVKLAVHKETNVQYAIKILDKKDIKQNELTLNVRREIAIMKALNHRNIVSLREVLSSKNKLYIVMDLVRGGELFERIQKQGELDEKTARNYFQQLVDGIDYCHKRGVFHRDLKPENLLVDENGVLKITDFGVSSVKKREGDLLFTTCGTPSYCAPEILANSPEGYNGEKVDSWACGVILYLLLVGELPFQHEDMGTLYEMIRLCRVGYPADLSPGAKDLLSKMLVKDPQKRYTLSDVKTHPWFLQDYDGSDGSLDGSQKMGSRKSGGIDGNRSREDMPLQRRSGDHLSGNLGASHFDRMDALGNGSRQGSQNNRDMVAHNGHSRHSVQSTEDDIAHDMHKSGSGFSGSGKIRGGNSLGNKGNFPAMAASVASEQPGLDHQNSYNAAAVTQSAANLTPQYTGKGMIEFIRDALPGKPDRKLEDTVQKLSEIDIDCVEDVQAVAEFMGNPEKFRQWLESESSLPAVTSMRISKMFFPYAM